MSKIKELINSRLNELALIELELKKAEEQQQDELKQDMSTTSVRLYTQTIKNMDIIAEKLDLTRSDIIRNFLDAGVREALIELEIDPLEWINKEYTQLGDDVIE